jgi:hypothetical protein
VPPPPPFPFSQKERKKPDLLEEGPAQVTSERPKDVRPEPRRSLKAKGFKMGREDRLSLSRPELACRWLFVGQRQK